MAGAAPTGPSAAGFRFGFAGAAVAAPTAAGCFAATAVVAAAAGAGIVKTLPQPGHLARLPTADAGAFSFFPHVHCTVICPGVPDGLACAAG